MGVFLELCPVFALFVYGFISGQENYKARLADTSISSRWMNFQTMLLRSTDSLIGIRPGIRPGSFLLLISY
jgi:hypothetical protein